MEDAAASLLDEIRARLELLESSLPTRIDAMEVSETAKLPFNALWCRATLLWRMVELSRSAFESFEKDKLAVAILLTRAAVETSAALWYLCGKIEAATTSGVVGDIGTHLQRLGMGSRIDSDMPQAISVLTFVDRVNQDVDGFRHQYDSLSELAHPNWRGTGLLYSKPDPQNLWVDLGTNLRGADGTNYIGVANLSVALMFFERSYNRIAEIMPAFITLCESQLKEAGRSPSAR